MNHVSVAIRIVRPVLKNTTIRCKSTKPKLSTFYDTLNLKPGCTKKDIRNSFIKLSKLNHPDICGPSSNDKFVNINEAYNVLIDDKKKKLYDETLLRTNNFYPIYYNNPQRKHSNVNWKDAYNNPDNHWLSSNIAIASVCLSILVIGSIMSYYGIKTSVYIRTTFSEKSNECLSFLEEQKQMKTGKSNDELIQLFEQNVAKEYGLIEKK